jgi:hypothetical protein
VFHRGVWMRVPCRMRSPRRSAFADKPKCFRRAVYSNRSAAVVTLAAGLVIGVAISRAGVTCCGARIARSLATADLTVGVEKRRVEPTLSR